MRAQISSLLATHTISAAQVDFSSLGAFIESAMEKQKHSYIGDDDDALYEVDSIIAVKRHPYKKKQYLYLATFVG